VSKSRKIALFVALDLLVVAAIVGMWLWWRSAPMAARLLPESDAMAYVNLQPMRLVSAFAQLPKPTDDPAYQAFIQATGFQFERDLDEVAIAVHMPAPPAPGGRMPDPRFSEIFVGRFDRARANDYFRKIATSTEQYGGHEIFEVPVEERKVRIALLSSNTVAVSNAEDPQAIHGMVERYGERWLPLRGPTLVREHYRDVPAGSLVWLIASQKNGMSFANAGIGLPPAFAGAVLVGSLRVLGDIRVQAEWIANNEADATQIKEQLGTMLGLFRDAQASAGTKGPDADVKQVFDSIAVTQEGSRARVTASIPFAFVTKLLTAAK